MAAVIDLGCLADQGGYTPFDKNGRPNGTQATAISDNLIVGGSKDADGHFRAVYWDLQNPTTIQKLPDTGWTADSVAYGADTDGFSVSHLVGGTQQVALPKKGYAYYWNLLGPPPTMANLTPPVSSPWGYLFRFPTGIARSIKVSKGGIDPSSGILVGEWTPPSVIFFPATRLCAVYWRLGLKNMPTRLPESAQRKPTTAAAINIHEAIVGQEDNGSETTGCLWRNLGSPPEDLPVPAWLPSSNRPNTSPWAINDSGWIVGTCGTNITPATLAAEQTQFPCVWNTNKNSIQAIGQAFYAKEKPSAQAYGFAYGINNKNFIVGKYYLDPNLLDVTTQKFVQTTAFVCDPQAMFEMIDLNKVVGSNWRGPSGETWVLEEARGINDDGKIIAYGHPLNASLPHRSFLITP
jgi:hypothetical protein